MRQRYLASAYDHNNADEDAEGYLSDKARRVVFARRANKSSQESHLLTHESRPARSASDESLQVLNDF